MPRCEKCGRYLRDARATMSEMDGLTDIRGVCRVHGTVRAMRGYGDWCWSWDYWDTSEMEGAHVG